MESDVMMDLPTVIVVSVAVGSRVPLETEYRFSP